MKVLYCLATSSFFLEGICGRVSHAYGFVNGLVSNGVECDILSGPGFEFSGLSRPDLVGNSTVNFGRFFFFCLIFKLFRVVSDYDIVVVRWRPHLVFFLLPFFSSRKKIWIEINGFTGIDSKYFLVRCLVTLSLWLSARVFNVIVVSDFSRNKLCDICSAPRKIYVMPNGYDQSAFSPLDMDRTGRCNLVYFGARQPYYDWPMLYSAVEKLLGQNVIGKLYLLGFDRVNESSPAISFYGQYQASDIRNLLSGIDSPILVLHSTDTQLARSGSPMKLYEYGALGIPVVISDVLFDRVSDFRHFFPYRAGDLEDFVRVVKCVSSNYGEASFVGKEDALDIPKRYGWPEITKQWLSSI